MPSLVVADFATCGNAVVPFVKVDEPNFQFDDPTSFGLTSGQKPKYKPVLDKTPDTRAGVGAGTVLLIIALCCTGCCCGLKVWMKKNKLQAKDLKGYAREKISVNFAAAAAIAAAKTGKKSEVEPINKNAVELEAMEEIELS